MEATVIYPRGHGGYPAKAHIIDVPDNVAEPLEWIWRNMNVVDGNELPIRLKCRSMMIGDMVLIGKDLFVCETVGFVKL